MTWVLATLVVVCLGLVGVLASGRWGGALPEVHDDRPDTRLDDAALPEGPLAAEHVRRVRFPLALRGYRMAEVDDLLARLADQLEESGRPEEPGQQSGQPREDSHGGSGGSGGSGGGPADH